jgi:hypothetical protein
MQSIWSRALCGLLGGPLKIEEKLREKRSSSDRTIMQLKVKGQNGIAISYA